MGVVCKRKHAPATDQQKIQEECITATNTNSCCIKQRNIIKMMQASLTSKYSKLLNFRHEEVIIQKLEEVLQFHQRSVYLDCSYTDFFWAQCS